MIGKIIAGSSFGGTVGYVMKEDARVLAAEGVTPPDVRDMVRDFKDQTLLNPRLKNTVGHISLSFSAKDADKLTDPAMAQIAKEYMERMGITDTQYLLVRHTDQAHPHCHLVYNRIGNDGQTISDKNIKIRNGIVCKELTTKYGLYYPKGKEQVRRERLREPDKTKYQIYDAIRTSLRGCRSWGDLEKKLQEQGITTQYKFCGATNQKQGVLFSKNAYTFSGSKVDRAFSYTRLDNYFTQAQRVGTPTIQPAAQPRYSAQSVTALSTAARRFRSAFEGLYGGADDSCGSVNLGGFGVSGGLSMPSSGSCGHIAPEQMRRRDGESPEAHIARITALLWSAAEAMVNAQAEYERQLREQQASKQRFRMR